MDPSSIIAIISVSATALAAFTTSLFHSLSLSRCSDIDCFCFKCKRAVLSEETYKDQSNKIDKIDSPKILDTPINFNQE